MTGVIPVQDLTTEDILYGFRETSHRYELYTHDPGTGLDSLIGTLDGVTDGSLQWSSGASVKKAGSITVVEVPTVLRAGFFRVQDIDRVTTRIRPVRVITGLPDTPLGMYVITAAPETWSTTGRSFGIELHDKSTILDQDKVGESFTAGTSDPVLTIIQDLVESSGEQIQVDGSNTAKLSEPLTWDAGTSKLQIVNDLLDVLNYNALWVDGVGNFRATPYVKPALRSIQYTVLNDEAGQALIRELVDGEQSIYLPDWTSDRDVYGVPNKVIATASGTGDAPPLSGEATNEVTDESSPLWAFSHARLGFWRSGDPVTVDVPDFSAAPDPEASTVAFLQAKAQQSLIASSAVQATVDVKCLPIPLELLDALRFASVPASVDARHTVQSAQLELKFDGVLSLTLQEVIDL